VVLGVCTPANFKNLDLFIDKIWADLLEIQAWQFNIADAVFEEQK
jgi:hypothetical protein